MKPLNNDLDQNNWPTSKDKNVKQIKYIKSVQHFGVFEDKNLQIKLVKWFQNPV